MANPNSELLAKRYGQKTRFSKTSQRLLAALGVSAITAGAIYFGIANFKGIEFKEVSFKVVSAQSVELTFEVTKPVDRAAVCSLKALNEQFAVVGYKSIEVSPNDAQKVRLTIPINTIELATTALVDDCTLK